MERLHRLLAQAGVASRRKAEGLILEGRVQVNGQVVGQLGVKVDPEHDLVEVDRQPIHLESRIYIILNKPRGFISDRDETGEKKTALDLVPQGERLYAAGRLDMESEGLLLLTNDGDLTFRLTHPRYEHQKEYLALVSGKPEDSTLKMFTRGIRYQEEWLKADSAAHASRKQPFGEAGRDESWLVLKLHEGKKRQIRHMCGAVGHPVHRLIRTRIGPIELDGLKPGKWRKLTEKEVERLKGKSGK